MATVKEGKGILGKDVTGEWMCFLTLFKDGVTGTQVNSPLFSCLFCLFVLFSHIHSHFNSIDVLHEPFWEWIGIKMCPWSFPRWVSLPWLILMSCVSVKVCLQRRHFHISLTFTSPMCGLRFALVYLCYILNYSLLESLDRGIMWCYVSPRSIESTRGLWCVFWTGFSDPYCILTILEDEQEHRTRLSRAKPCKSVVKDAASNDKIYETDIKKQTLNPIWNQTFILWVWIVHIRRSMLKVAWLLFLF